jgi:hypothetical protein
MHDLALGRSRHVDPFGLQNLLDSASNARRTRINSETPEVGRRRGELRQASQGSLDLVALNMSETRVNTAIQLGDAFIAVKAKYWVAKNTDTVTYKATLEGRRAYEEWVIGEMNKYMTVVHWIHKAENMVCVRWVKPNGEWQFFTKNPRGMKDLLKGYKIFVIDQKQRTVRHFLENRPSIADVPISELALPADVVKKIKKERNAEGALVITFPPLDSFMEQTEQVELFDFWFNHPDHSRREAIVFDPRPPMHRDANDSERFLNSWKGMAKGFSRDDVKDFTNWQLCIPLLNHLRWSLSENDKQFCHMLGWISHLIKHPWIKLETTPSYHGPQGSGKTIFWTLIAHIIGTAHSAIITNMLDLTGEFTANTADKILLVCDEVMFKGDKEANIMKNLQTAKWQRVRMMFHDPTYTESFLNFVLAFNKLEWTSVFGAKQRRNLYLSSCIEELLKHPIYEGLKEDPEDAGASPSRYFAFLEGHAKANDCAALKTFTNMLYNLPLDNYNPRTLPPSYKAWEVAVISLPPVHRWWYDALCNRYMSILLPYEQKRKKNDEGEDPDSLQRDDDAEDTENYKPNTVHLGRKVTQWPNNIFLYFVYRGYLDKFPNGGEKNVKEEDFLHELMNLCPEITVKNVTDNLYSRGSTKKVTFPTVEVCRKHWKKTYPTVPFDDQIPYKSVGALFESRLKEASDYEMLNPFPTEFFGYNIRAEIESGAFNQRIQDTAEWMPDSMLETEKVETRNKDVFRDMMGKRNRMNRQIAETAAINSSTPLRDMLSPYKTAKDWCKLTRESVYNLINFIYDFIHAKDCPIKVDSHLLDSRQGRYRVYAGRYLYKPAPPPADVNSRINSITEEEHKKACKLIYRLRDKLLEVDGANQFVHREVADEFGRAKFNP